MANINMISGLRAEVLRARRITRGLFYGVAGTLVAILATFLYTSTAILAARHEISQAEAQLARLRPKIERIQALETLRAELKPKLTTLQEAQANTERWYGILTSLQRSIPGQMWLTNLSVEKGADDSQVLRLNGVTLSSRLVGEAMQRLNQEIRVLDKYVDLRYVQPAAIGVTDAVEFELAAQLQKTSGERAGNEADAK